MKSFLFIIPLTPQSYLTPLRKELFSLFLSALKQQTYENWEVLLLGEEEKKDGKFTYIRTEAVTKEDKFLVAIDYLKSLKTKPDYVIRIDDDDLISPSVLKRASKLDFDCYADRYHTFYDISTCKISQSRREWLPNTVIHKFEHALANVRKPDEILVHNNNFFLIGLDHNIYWEKYYRDKKILWAERDNPVYLRILSPTSITNQLKNNEHVNTWNNEHQIKFNKYTNGYGPWVYKRLSDFRKYDNDLKAIWERFSNKPVKRQATILDLLDYLKYNFNFHAKKEIKRNLLSEIIVNKSYQICTRCILDTTVVSNIQFDEGGICNYCQYYDELVSNNLYTGENRHEKLSELVNKIKQSGKGKEYDCIIGVSGGVDSTYLAYFVKELGLRPLAVHLDYGWNSELAVKNIENILQKLEIDLYTYVVDWEEIKDLQLAFLKASVVDIELINDFAILATLHNTCYQRGIKYLLHGYNIVTEGGLLPSGWTWSKYDQLNIMSIHKKFGSIKLKTYPKLSFLKRLFYQYFYKLENVGILNYINYDRKVVKEIIKNELSWRDYGGKHFESIFTRFYQGYILPRKFNVNKRKFHLSVLICSGQLTKEQALEQMMIDDYSIEQQNEDKEYVSKKLGLTEAEFENYMNLPIKKHSDYPSYLNKHYKYHEQLMKLIKSFINISK